MTIFGAELLGRPGKISETDALGEDGRLYLSAFSQTAELAGNSRIYGGYDIQSDNVEGLIMGRKVGALVRHKAQMLIG